MDKSFFCKNSSFQKSKYVFLPVPLEKTVSYKKGTAKGPDAILKASFEVEDFNEILMKPVKKIPICVLKPLDCSLKHTVVISNIEKNIFYLYSNNKFPIILGGEHSLSIGVIRGILKHLNNFTIIQIDAHSDMRKTYHNNKLSHACTMYNILKLDNSINLIQIGIRSMANVEISSCDEFKDRIHTFWDYSDIFRCGFNKILSKIKELIYNRNVYLTVDVDGFDFVQSSTGTPEPAGISYYQAIELFKTIVKNSNLLGADFVELAPIKAFHAPDFFVAKLILNLLFFKEAQNGKIFM